jgi:hypothetical protein
LLVNSAMSTGMITMMVMPTSTTSMRTSLFDARPTVATSSPDTDQKAPDTANVRASAFGGVVAHRNTTLHKPFTFGRPTPRV